MNLELLTLKTEGRVRDVVFYVYIPIQEKGASRLEGVGDFINFEAALEVVVIVEPYHNISLG